MKKMRMKVLCFDLGSNADGYDLSRKPRKSKCVPTSTLDTDYRMSPPHLVTEDTPPDMLTGNMDLRLVLPNGNRVKMSVDRRTPMMDLLVHLTTAYKISPAGHVLQPYGETGLLPYKPSTPIGALDTWTVHIVPKNQATQNPANKISLKQIVQPFEQTNRFQVYLPRNQLYVTRVSGRTTMAEILKQACKEKELDSNKYTLKHPKHLDGPSLCEDLSVAEYGHNQVSMVSSRVIRNTISTEDILAMKNYNTKSSESSRSLSPDSSVSPQNPVQPSRPFRKRRPAPKPPVQPKNETLKIDNAPVICHSRTSSDSSGYHEASVLSEGPDSNNSSLPDSLPRRSKLPSEKPINKLSRSLSNLHHPSTSASGMKPAQSTSSLAPSRKKKPAPPPPLAIAEEREEPTTPRVSHTLPPGARLSNPTRIEPVAIQEQVDSQIVGRVPIPIPRRLNLSVFDRLEEIMKKINGVREDDTKTTSCSSVSLSDLETERIEEEIERMFDQATREHVSLESGVDLGESPELNNNNNNNNNNNISHTNIERNEDDPFNWEYKLPAPPTFRDDTSSPTVTEYSTMTVGQIKEVFYEKIEEPKVVPEVVVPPPRPPQAGPVLISITPKEEAKKQIVAELSQVLANNGQNLKQPKKEILPSKNKTIDNFILTTYSSKKPVKVYEEKKNESHIIRRSSFAENVKQSSPVKRSVSHVPKLSRNRFSTSNTNLVELKEESPLEFLNRSRLRKTNSELSINIDPNENKDRIKEETGLQSLQVLRSILPQLSQSQGAMNHVGVTQNEKVERNGLTRPKVNLSVSTWEERPKRQVSIKSDRDYTIGCKNAVKTPEKPKTTPVASPSKLIASQSFKGPKTVAYKTLETGNTKPLKQMIKDKEESIKENTRLPVVRSVELKKPYKMDNRPVSCYLFGYEPPPAPKMDKKYTSIVNLNKKVQIQDPREELLQSIRCFGRQNLKKVSAR